MFFSATSFITFALTTGLAAPPTSADGDTLPDGAVIQLGTGRFRVGEVYPNELSSDGNKLLVGNIFLDTLTGRELGRIPETIPNDDRRVRQIIPIPGGNRVALMVSRYDGNSHVRSIVVWDVMTRTKVRSIALDWLKPPDTFVKMHGVIQLHPQSVSPSGNQILFGTGGRTVILGTDLDTNPSLTLLDQTAGGGWYGPPTFTPDGKHVIDVGNRVRLRDAKTGKQEREFAGPAGAVIRLAMSRNGKRFAVISGEAPPPTDSFRATDYRVSLWDLEAGKEARVLADRLTGRVVGSSETFSLLFTPDGESVVALDTDRTAGTIVRCWRVTGKALPTWTLPREPWFGTPPPHISPDGKTLYMISQHGVRTFDLASGAERSPEDLKAGGMYPIGISADGREVLTAGQSGRIETWSVETGKRIRDEKLPDTITENQFQIHYSPDARLVVVDRTVGPNNQRDTVVFDRTTGKQLCQLPGKRCGVIGPDGARLVTISSDFKSSIVRDAGTGKLLHTLPCEGNDNFYLSSDGKAFGRPWRHNSQAFDAESGACLFEGKEFLPEYLKSVGIRRGRDPEPDDHVSAYALGPGGKHFAVAAVRYWHGVDRPAEHHVLMFDSNTRKLLWEKNPDLGRQFGLSYTGSAFSPDGSKYALGGYGKLLLYDVASGRLVHSYDGHRKWVYYLRFTPDGKRIVASDLDGTVWVWNADKPDR
jgi:WD40 repeat protein